MRFPLPFTPVPVTLQTFAVLLVGASLGSLRGASAMALYALAGVVGVPWFAENNSGWRSPPSATSSASSWRPGSSAGWLSAARTGRCCPVGLMVLGNVVIYVFGVAGLMLGAEPVRCRCR